MDIIAAAAATVVIFAILGKLIALPLCILWKLITNSIVGAVILWVINLLGVGIEITFLKALVAGIFGVPGVILVLIAHAMGH
ncbi:pro-sigmaK processing inhibitor BofA family protein [uncultured Selenomonas sp.]|uniref:pro-sigmaK processing inhibitor BofA family protein n=1 Tax=uncultured Selenomonas sp. TaxID=159275 RepID=UPI0028D7D9B9|nr:pro-sigmaK processing inhibitor BofA family protein [uncultured Selenomonas sp.]